MKTRSFYGWVVVIDLLIVLAIVLGTRYSFGVLFKSIEGEFHLTRAATSAINSVYMVFCCIFAILGGWALDSYGPRIIVAVMGLFTALSLILTSQVSSVWQLLFTYSLLLAVGTGTGFTIVSVTVSRWFVRQRGLAMGIATSGEGLGTLAMPPFVVYLISGFGWRACYVVMGLIAGLLMIASSLLLKKDRQQIDTAAPVKTQGRNEDAEAVSFSLPEAFRTRSFWLLSTIWLFFSLCNFLLLTHIVANVTDIGLSVASAAAVIAIIGATSIPSRLVIGRVSDRISRKLTGFGCALIMAASMVWVAWSQSLWMFYVFAVAYGFAYGGLSTVIAALISDIFGLASLGVITGALVVGFSIGAAAGPIVGGFIYDVTGNYSLAFTVAAAAMLIAALLLSLVRRETRPAGNRGS